MESFVINLNEMGDKGNRYKRLLIILALFFLVTSAFTFFILHKLDKTNEWIFLGLGIYFLLYIYFGFVGYNAKMYINADEFALEYQFGFFKKVPERVIWETITKVKFGFTYITFYKKTGKKKVLVLNWLSYSKIKEIKHNIELFSTKKGITVEITEYHEE